MRRLHTSTICALLLVYCINALAQPFVTSRYEIGTETDVFYGNSINFSGKVQPLLLNLAHPVDDEVPACGRPLMIVIHGGAFMGGSKDDYTVDLWMKEFARKGYVAASIGYRLGMFQRSEPISCSVDNWGCVNVADTIEWHRALFRGMQDTRGALRYLLTRSGELQIDPSNVFLIGESAGGFISLAVAFNDDNDPESLQKGAVNPVARPDAGYDGPCLPPFSYPSDSMLLGRPDLGPPQGELYPGAPSYIIRGVASVYGGIMADMFNNDAGGSLPSVYFYAQPNDLIVPFGQGRVMQGLSDCAVQYGTCPAILGVPYVRGNKGIVDLLASKAAQGMVVPDYQADFTQNTADCLLQIAFPVLSGHALDDIWVRTKNMAVYFASKMSTDCSNGVDDIISASYRPFPNPVLSTLTIRELEGQVVKITLIDTQGRRVGTYNGFPVDMGGLPQGAYFMIVDQASGRRVYRIIK